MKKTTIQISITIGALLLAATHLVRPALSIDGVVAVLILVAIIPWVSPLFKSLELPGGLKFEFHELQKVEKQAKEVGLIKEETTQLLPIEYPFMAVAETDPNLALAGLRIEIEKRLRKLAAESNIEFSRRGLRGLMNDLSKNQLLTTGEKSTLEDLMVTLNNAAHGENFDLRASNWVIENGPKILASLDGKIDKRVEVRATSLPYNMAAWGHEKSERVLLTLARLIDSIKTEFKDNPRLQEELFGYLAPAIWDASKLYSLFNDTEWQTADSDLIMQEGVQGFEKIKHRYNRA